MNFYLRTFTLTSTLLRKAANRKAGLGLLSSKNLSANSWMMLHMIRRVICVDTSGRNLLQRKLEMSNGITFSSPNVSDWNGSTPREEDDSRNLNGNKKLCDGIIAVLNRLERLPKEKNARMIITFLVSNQIATDDILEVFTDHIKLLEIPHSKWLQCFDLLSNNNFPPNHILRIFKNSPEILEADIEIVIEGLENLRKLLHLSTSGSLQKFVYRNPAFLLVDGGELVDCLSFVEEHFSSEITTKLVQSCPNLILESKKKFLNRYHYAELCMGIEPEEMFEGGLFCHPIEDIIMRHQLLFRSGLYEMPDIDGKTHRIKNPPLRSILTTDDHDFLHKTCSNKLKQDEYDTFKEMIEEEGYHLFLQFDESLASRKNRKRMEREEDDDSDYDSDSEHSDSDEFDKMPIYKVDPKSGMKVRSR